MALLNGSAFRVDPGSGQRIRAKIYTDPIDGNAVTQELVLLAGSPARFIKACLGSSPTQVSGLEYPYNGTAETFVSGTTAANPKLNSTAMGGTAGNANALDPTGLALVVMSGTYAGDFRIITGWNDHANRVVNLDRNLSGAPSTSDKYKIAYFCEFDTELILKTEFSSSGADKCSVGVTFFDLGQTYSGSARAPLRYFDRVVDVMNTSVQIDGGSVYQGQTLSVPCKGGMAASFYLTSAPPAGTVDVWLTSI